ncbi:unnamed protein product, partial [Mycena citricolor]
SLDAREGTATFCDRIPVTAVTRVLNWPNRCRKAVKVECHRISRCPSLTGLFLLLSGGPRDSCFYSIGIDETGP